MASMLIALNAGEVDKLFMNKLAAEYLVSVNPEYMISCAERAKGAYYTFGFLNDSGSVLHKDFNHALHSMEKDGMLNDIIHQYCTPAG